MQTTNRDDLYCFALNPGAVHTGVCSKFEGEKNAHVLTGVNSPDRLIEGLFQTKNYNKNRKIAAPSGLEEGHTPHEGPKNITRLKHIINAGIYDEYPFEHTYIDSRFRFIDFVIFDKWARYIWKNNELVNIGARVVDCRWIGSFKFSEVAHEKIIRYMKKNREIWFSIFWRQDKNDKKYVFVKFCLDCSSSFSEIKKKIFASGIRENGTYDEFKPNIGDKVDVLIGARWATMTKEQCHEKCPVNWMCDKCNGAYWAKCNSPKQVEPFPADKLTKNKGK